MIVNLHCVTVNQFSGSAEMDGITFTFPSSPLLTQAVGGHSGTLCTKTTCPKSMKCECVHVKSVPLGNTVEIVLVDQGKLFIN